MIGTRHLTVRQSSPAPRERAARYPLAAVLLLASLPLAGHLPSPEEAEAPATSAPQHDPQQLVADLAARLFAELGRHRAQYRRDPQLIVPTLERLLSPHFDANYTARLVLGAHWRTAAAEYRERFATALLHTLLSSYAESIVAWTPERFQLLPFEGDATALQATIRTQVMRSGGSFAAVDYRLHRTGDDWQVFDVLVDGVSYVRTYHDDVDSDVTQRGPEFALERIEKAARRTAQPQDPAAR
ncbi:MAG TPA: ABC transporter substrate-binding protein [Steroidobacteraceae bacterium]|jgi:phospholipid transport system substrate-binding protein|nr:ABC transporter substrate-binding protein [Steroidobacteraceae bacterium]